jgi:hypothetical protein
VPAPTSTTHLQKDLLLLADALSAARAENLRLRQQLAGMRRQVNQSLRDLNWAGRRLTRLTGGGTYFRRTFERLAAVALYSPDP